MGKRLPARSAQRFPRALSLRFDTSGGCVVNVLVFCDPAYRAADFLSGFRGSGHRVSFVCCNTSRTGHTSSFYASQLYGALRHKPAWVPALFWMWLLGRLLIAHD